MLFFLIFFISLAFVWRCSFHSTETYVQIRIWPCVRECLFKWAKQWVKVCTVVFGAVIIFGSILHITILLGVFLSLASLHLPRNCSLFNGFLLRNCGIRFTHWKFNHMLWFSQLFIYFFRLLYHNSTGHGSSINNRFSFDNFSLLLAQTRIRRRTVPTEWAQTLRWLYISKTNQFKTI